MLIHGTQFLFHFFHVFVEISEVSLSKRMLVNIKSGLINQFTVIAGQILKISDAAELPIQPLHMLMQFFLVLSGFPF